jgi:predicted transposase/invertase (TIGR01784 family)
MKYTNQRTWITPLNDAAFKKVFGEKQNMPALKDFLGYILDLPQDEYAKLVPVNTFLLPWRKRGKGSILDIRVHTTSGMVLNVELQVVKKKGMRERLVCYLSRLIAEQLSRGDDYIKLRRSYCVAVCGYDMLEEEKDHLNRYSLLNHKSYKPFTDHLNMVILELPKLERQLEQDAGAVDEGLRLWVQFLTSESESELLKLKGRSKAVDMAIEVMQKMNLRGYLRALAEAKERERLDRRAELMYAYDEGMNKGVDKGRTEAAAQYQANEARFQAEIAELRRQLQQVQGH